MGLLHRIFGESKRELREELAEIKQRHKALYDENSQLQAANKSSVSMGLHHKQIDELRKERDEYKQECDNMECINHDLAAELYAEQYKQPQCRTCGKFLPKYCNEHKNKR